MRSLVAVLVAVAAVLSKPVLAQTTPEALTPVWQTADLSGGDHYYSSPDEACEAQKAFFVPTHSGPAYAVLPEGGGFAMYRCKWGNVPGPAASSVFLECMMPDGNINASAKKVYPGVCTHGREVTHPVNACGYDNGTKLNPPVGNPVLVRDGSAYQAVEDFATADGRLKVARTYRSLLGIIANLPGSASLGFPWRFGHEWTLQLSGFFDHSGSLSLLAPDLSAYDFEFQTGGSVIRKTDASADAVVSFENTYGPDVNASQVLNGGGKFIARTSDNETIELTLYVPPGQTKFTRGRPTRITFNGGYRWVLTYGSQGQLTEIADNFGRELTFTWLNRTLPGETTSRPMVVSKIVLPDGTSLRYSFEEYDGTRSSGFMPQRLYKVERLSAAGTVLSTETYHYEDPDLINAVTGVTDNRNVRYLNREYDWMGRVTSTSHPNSNDRTQVAYSNSPDNWHAIRTVTNAVGKKTVYKFKRLQDWTESEFSLVEVTGEPSANCVGTTRTISYAAGKPSSEIDEEGRETRFTYHPDGRYETVVRAFGRPEAELTSYTWHPTLNLPTEIRKPGLTTTNLYQSSGRLMKVTEMDTTTHTVPYPTSGQTRVWTFTYAGGGLVDTLDGPLPGTGDTVNYDYDAAGYLTKVTNELGHVTDVTGVNGRGQPTSITDPNGRIYTLAYDDLGRLASVTVDIGAAPRVTTFAYTPVGFVSKITLPDASSLEYTYSGARRLLSVENNAGETIEYTYNLLGKPTSRTVKDSQTAIVAKQSQTLDELGRVLSLIGAAGQK